MPTKEDTKITKNTFRVLSVFFRETLALDNWSHIPFDRAWSALQHWLYEIMSASRNSIERAKIHALIVVHDFVRPPAFRPDLWVRKALPPKLWYQIVAHSIQHRMLDRALFRNVRDLKILKGEQWPLTLFLVYPSSSFKIFSVTGIDPQDLFGPRSIDIHVLYKIAYATFLPDPSIEWEKSKYCSVDFTNSRSHVLAKNHVKLGRYPKSKT